MAANEEHLRAQAVIKECHKSLREDSKVVGVERAWQQHLQNEAKMLEYADAMHKLAAIWDKNISKDTTPSQRSRVLWVQQYCMEYFYAEPPIYMSKREREQRMLQEWPDLQEQYKSLQLTTAAPDPLHVLDVGSCFNPFTDMPHFAVTAIDLCPATPDVMRGDFLQLPVVNGIDHAVTSIVDSNCREVLSLPANHYNCVIFSLLLEYMPSGAQRVECCRKAYTLLQSEGLLLIITPDSQHAGKNAKLMKNWRYTLATLGFMRVRYEKLLHITCMAFRKSILPGIAQRWAENHHEPYMRPTIEIPQDTNNQTHS